MSLNPPDPGVDQNDETGACHALHCFHAFDALYCALTPGAAPVPAQFADDKYPLFVTWTTRRSQRLRGCIGNFDPMPLHEGLAEYALISAFRDHRFKKVERTELTGLQCCVSLLTHFEDAASYLDWTVGVHGINISFPHPSTLIAASSSESTPMSSSGYLPTIRATTKTFHACYLPDVIPEQGWDRIEAVDSAIHKAGWTGRITEDIRRSVKLRRYQSSTFDVSWDEYAQWRQAQGYQVI